MEILGLKSRITKVKSLEKLNDRFELAKKSISTLEDRLIETAQPEEQKNRMEDTKGLKKDETTLSTLPSNESTRKRKKKVKSEKKFKEIMVKYVPNMLKKH